MSNSRHRSKALSSRLGKLLRAVTPAHFLTLLGQRGMAPTIGPDVAPSLPTITSSSHRTVPLRRSSTVSTASNLEGDSTSQRSLSRTTSSSSILFEDGDVDVVRVEGLRHSHEKLEARRYKTVAFAEQLIKVLRGLHVPFWVNQKVTAESVMIHKVSGSLTNAVFFVSCPSIPLLPVILLRIYGPSSDALISRPKELRILHVLSSQYRIGPRVYGTFENGRLEEYFDSTALTPEELRDEKVSGWIGARMAELHQVDIEAVEQSSSESRNEDENWQIAVEKNVRSWITPARDVLALPLVPESVRKEFDLDRFEAEWDHYLRSLHKMEKREGASRRVFCHNDTQYGNLLRLTNVKKGSFEHRQIIVVDFEYASANPAAYDIANHFHEWTADYHSSTPHLLNPDRYPTAEQRRNFYRAYLTHAGSPVPSSSSRPVTEPIDEPLNMELQMQELESQVRAWSPASHGMWAIWGLVQAREILEGKDREVEFDYAGYARCRMESFRREIRALSI